MNEAKNNQSNPGQAVASGGSAKAERVRSSRYEWENSSGEGEKSAAAAKAPGRSLMAAVGRWLKKFFSDSRGFFDNDDDATPSAA